MDLLELPPVETLRQLLAYDPETGAFTWQGRGEKWDGKPAFNTARPWGYRWGKFMGSGYAAHRIAWKHHHGADPANIIDHINGDPADNRIINLRVVNDVESARNRAIHRNNRTGQTGVTQMPASGRGHKRWTASIRNGERIVFLGHFFTKEEAVAARQGAERVLGYHPNHGRKGLTPSPRHHSS